MLKHLNGLALMVLGVICLSPAFAQTPPPGTNVGALTCRMAPSIGLILGSRQRMACRFAPNGSYPPEAYVGVMNNIGLDAACLIANKSTASKDCAEAIQKVEALATQ